LVSISFSTFQGGTFQKIARIFYTVSPDAIGMIVALFGQLACIFAALIHVGSEPTFILNSDRLFRHRGAQARS
jgi:cation transport ATPase